VSGLANLTALAAREASQARARQAVAH